jgi:hypothetical protein
VVVHLVENIRESVQLPLQEEEYVEGVQVRRTERLELGDHIANRVCCGMRDESEDMRADTGR